MVSSAEHLPVMGAEPLFDSGDPKDLPARKLLSEAARLSGRGVFDLKREHRRLKKGRGQLTLSEYVMFGLYDPLKYGADEQSRFVGRARRWPLTEASCDLTWQAVLEDKWLCDTFMERADVPMPVTLAVIDGSMREWPETDVLRTVEDARAFFLEEATMPIFGRVNRGMDRGGSILIEHADRDGVHLRGAGLASYEVLLNDIAGRRTYVLQPAMTAHHFFHHYTDALPTIRVSVLVTDHGVHIPSAVLRLQRDGQVSDSFWKEGNLTCAIEVDTGRILSARSRVGIEIREHQAHPDTSATFAAEVLPFWPETLELIDEIALMVAPVRYQSMDIAITEAGPVLMDISTGGSFEEAQFASGKGFLTDEVTEFFRSCGVTDL